MMKLALIVLLSVAAASAGVARLNQLARVSPARNNPFGVVPNIEDCGSNGLIHEVHVQGCDMAPCNFVPGNTYEIAMLFWASRDSERLDLSIRVLLDTGAEHLVATVPVEGEIKQNEQFTISFGLPITTQFSGRSLVVWFELKDARDQRMEICATASAHIA